MGAAPEGKCLPPRCILNRCNFIFRIDTNWIIVALYVIVCWFVSISSFLSWCFSSFFFFLFDKNFLRVKGWLVSKKKGFSSDSAPSFLVVRQGTTGFLKGGATSLRKSPYSFPFLPTRALQFFRVSLARSNPFEM